MYFKAALYYVIHQTNCVKYTSLYLWSANTEQLGAMSVHSSQDKESLLLLTFKAILSMLTFCQKLVVFVFCLKSDGLTVNSPMSHDCHSSGTYWKSVCIIFGQYTYTRIFSLAQGACWLRQLNCPRSWSYSISMHHIHESLVFWLWGILHIATVDLICYV